MPEPSHEPCPMCGESDKKTEEYFIQEKAERAIWNLKFLHLGFTICNNMTEFERSVFFRHQIRKESFQEISQAMNKPIHSIYAAWKRCKSRSDKTLEQSII
ncbi:MAG: hypothetical protein Tp1111SUR768151_29 [Prokaryotic dsDNA virus sp.]|nr:MAG: hypothetical protein Tp1111SUR768151_29 [Prokaryotic dsDNA virus sp.]|tara:strand:- start:73 stop:375 length:303 start_codon:yes stop_codon:yes gene_type:complete